MCEKLGEKRLNIKKERMKNLLKIASPNEALYREFMLALGYKNNKNQFLQLALICPFSEIKKLKERKLIEDALLHRAGFIDASKVLPQNFDTSLKMDKSVWILKRVRPVNRPERRIKDISYLLAESTKLGIFEYFRRKIENSFTKNIIKRKDAQRIVEKIMDFPKIGKQRKQEIFFNIILPFFIVKYEEEKKKNYVKFLETLFSLHPPLADNSITKKIKKILKIKKINSVKEYMGLIQFYYENKKEGKSEFDNT